MPESKNSPDGTIVKPIEVLEKEAERTADVRRKRYIVAYDHMKTLSFGVIGAAYVTPLVKHEALGWQAYTTILVGGAFLIHMLIWPAKAR